MTPNSEGHTPPDTHSPQSVIPPGERGHVVIHADHCKGCELCVHVCPPEVLTMSTTLNHQGYHPAQFAGRGCTGCSICFYICPEPGAIAVYRREASDD